VPVQLEPDAVINKPKPVVVPPPPPPVVIPKPPTTTTPTAVKSGREAGDGIYLPTTSPNVTPPQYVTPAVIPPVVIAPTTEAQKQQVQEAQFTQTQIFLATPEGTQAVERYQEPYIAAAAKETPQYAVTYTEGGVESTVVFNTKDKAEGFAENIREPDIKVSSVRAIPGPGAGPAPGTFGAEVSSTLSGAFQSMENWFESLPKALREASKQSAVNAAEAKSLDGLTGGVTAGDAWSAILRFDAGVVEGATFLLRPTQWAQLAALPILVAANPAGYARAVGSDISGTLFEGAGALAGGFLAGKAFNAAGEYVQGKYNQSELAQLNKLHPIDEAPVDWSSNAKYGAPAEMASVEGGARLTRGSWGNTKMYSGALAILDFDTLIARTIPSLRGGVDPFALGAVTSLEAAARLSSQPVLSTVTVEVVRSGPSVMLTPELPTVYQPVKERERTISEVSQTRITPPESIVKVNQITGETTRIDQRTKPGVTTIETPDTVVDVTAGPDVIVDTTTDTTTEVIPVVVPVVVPIVKPRIFIPKTRGKPLSPKERREQGVSLYSVTFNYTRSGEARTVEAQSYSEAYAKAERSRRVGGQPSQVRIVKI
jgi:hypothetical protein